MDLIDANWIRSRLTHRHGELKELATSIGLSPDKITKILKGERQIKAHEAQKIVAFFSVPVRGLSEPAALFRHQVAPAGGTVAARAMGAILCPDVRNPEAYRVKEGSPAAGLLAGDVLIVELGMTGAPGDLVIATIADTDSDTQVTVVRRYWPPLLVPLSADDEGLAIPADGDQRTGIVASVKAVARGPAIR